MSTTDDITLVTGGAGFIGSHLVDALVAAGETVRIIDNLDPLAHPGGVAPTHLNPDAEMVVADLGDPDAVASALDGVARIYHLAGVVGNGESMVKIRKAVDANAGATATLIEAIIERRDTVQRLVMASSMVVYGEGAYSCSVHGQVPSRTRPIDQLRAREWEPRCPVGECGLELAPIPIVEDTPLRPMSVYGITKRDQEELALVLGDAYDFEAVALRYLSTFGSRQQLSNPYTGVAAIFAARMLSGKRPLVFEDGRQLRDVVHVSDVVAATRAAMAAPAAPGQPINIGSGQRIEIADMAKRLAAAIGSDLGPELTGEFRVGDIRHCFADISRAEQLLDWQPQGKIDDGLAELAGWLEGQLVKDQGDQALVELRRRGILQ